MKKVYVVSYSYGNYIEDEELELYQRVVSVSSDLSESKEKYEQIKKQIIEEAEENETKYVIYENKDQTSIEYTFSNETCTYKYLLEISELNIN